MKLDEAGIYDHYSKEAEKLGLSKNCTMPDDGVKELEIKIIEKYIDKKMKLMERPLDILEVGCGNGFTASQLLKYSRKFIAVDYNEKMIDISKTRNLSIEFRKESATSLCFHNEFDIVYTERCLMNLISWGNQKKALHKIRDSLKVGGCLIMIETFVSGWEMLNSSRNILGLKDIPIPSKNTPFNDKEFEEFIPALFSKSDLIENNDENFLSSYYYGARILYPSLIEGFKNLEYNNPFIRLFKYLPPILNYSPVQLRVLEKL